MRPYILSETNYRDLQKINFDLAVLPWGATEAHNYHLPYGTDVYETEAIIAEAARIAWEDDTKSLVLPAIPFGVNTGQSDIPGTINIYPSTQAIILHDILESLDNFNINKVLILNGHGGNDFKQILREVGSDFSELFLATANWYQSFDRKEYFENEGDHAEEMETSLMMHIHPELVLPLSEAGDGQFKKFTSELLNEKWTWSERKWSKVTKDTGIGNPEKATKSKGKIIFEVMSKKIAQLLMEIKQLNIGDPYS